MNRTLRHTLVALTTTLLLAPLAGLHAAEFYVAPSGDDHAQGTREQPFASLERARDAVRQLKKGGQVSC